MVLFILMHCLLVWSWPMCKQYPYKPEEGIISPSTEVTDSCELVSEPLSSGRTVNTLKHWAHFSSPFLSFFHYFHLKKKKIILRKAIASSLNLSSTHCTITVPLAYSLVYPWYTATMVQHPQCVRNIIDKTWDTWHNPRKSESSLEASEAPSKPPLQLHWDLPFEHQSFALDLLSLLCAPLHKPSYSLQPMGPVPHSQSASLKNTWSPGPQSALGLHITFESLWGTTLLNLAWCLTLLHSIRSQRYRVLLRKLYSLRLWRPEALGSLLQSR